MGIEELKRKILSINNDIDYLNDEINRIMNDASFTEEEKKYFIDSRKQRISKKVKALNRYQTELATLEAEHNLILINNLKKEAIKSITGLVSSEQLAYYRNLLSSNDIKTIKTIIDSINDIVRNDYINKITSVEAYDSNSPYRFICHCISYTGFDINQEYEGNYISCSVLSNEQNDTYSSNFGLIYPPESIVAASSKDFAVNNNAVSKDDLLILQHYPTILNIDALIRETVERKNKANSKEYNEVVVKKTEPIGIFYKGNYEELDNMTKTNIEKLKRKYPHLKVIGLPKVIKEINIDATNIKHPKAHELNELEKQKQIAKLNNNMELYNQIQQQIYQLVYDNRMEMDAKVYDTLDIDSKIRFAIIKLHESRVLRDKDEFNYWNNVIKSLNEKKQASESEKTNVNSNNVGNLELPNLIEQLKKELIKIQNTYRSMTEDGYIDDGELSILLDMVNKVLKDGYSLKAIATDSKDIQVITIIINDLEEEQRRMIKMQKGTEKIGITF